MPSIEARRKYYPVAHSSQMPWADQHHVTHASSYDLADELLDRKNDVVRLNEELDNKQKEFRELKADLKAELKAKVADAIHARDQDVACLKAQVTRLLEKCDKKDEAFSIMQELLQARDEEIVCLKSRCSVLPKESQAKDEELSDLKAKLLTQNIDLMYVKSQVGGLLKEIDHLSVMKEKLKYQNEQRTRATTSQQSRIAGLVEEAVTKDKQLSALKEVLQARDKELNITKASLESQITGLMKNAEAKDVEISVLKGQLRAKHDELILVKASHQSQVTGLMKDAGARDEEMSTLKDHLHARDAELDQLETSNDALHNTIKELHQALGDNSVQITAQVLKHNEALQGHVALLVESLKTKTQELSVAEEELKVKAELIAKEGLSDHKVVNSEETSEDVTNAQDDSHDSDSIVITDDNIPVAVIVMEEQEPIKNVAQKQEDVKKAIQEPFVEPTQENVEEVVQKNVEEDIQDVEENTHEVVQQDVEKSVQEAVEENTLEVIQDNDESQDQGLINYDTNDHTSTKAKDEAGDVEDSDSVKTDELVEAAEVLAQETGVDIFETETDTSMGDNASTSYASTSDNSTSAGGKLTPDAGSVNDDASDDGIATPDDMSIADDEWMVLASSTSSDQ